MTTVLSRGRSCKMLSPNVAPTPRVHNVTGACENHRYYFYIYKYICIVYAIYVNANYSIIVTPDEESSTAY